MKNLNPARWASILLALMVALAAPSIAAEETPRIDRPVVDRAGVVSEKHEKAIGQQLRAHYAKTGVQMAVLVVPTTGREPIETFSLRVAEQWEGGRAGEDRGVLLTLAIEDRRSRLEVGYGLESILTDSVSARILADIRPQLRQKRYGDAVAMVADDVMGRTDHLRPGEAIVPTLEGWWESPVRGFWTAFLLGVFIVGLLSVLRRFDVGFMTGKRGMWAIVGGFVVTALLVGIATQGVMWWGYMALSLWGSLLGLTTMSEDSFAWGVPLVLYLLFVVSSFIIPELGEALILGESAGSLAYTVLVHALHLMFGYMIWFGITSKGGSTGGRRPTHRVATRAAAAATPVAADTPAAVGRSGEVVRAAGGSLSPRID